MAGATYTENPEHQKYMWEQFKVEYGKHYETMTEETHRFGVFISNLRTANLRNEQERQSGGTAVHGITRFFDLEAAEFAKQFLGSDPKLRSEERNSTDAYTATAEGLAQVSEGSSKDWTGVLTTPVKDQGYCGSCWAFSATEQIESDSMRVLGTSYILSPEQITQCDKTSYGCNGGWTEHAYKYVKSAGGIEQNSDYPYTSYQGVTGSCHVDASKEVISINGYTTISGESNMASYVLSTGPLSVCVDAETWNSYKGGIMSACGTNIDHCVQAVGVDTSSGGYWKVRNSWGTSWGESGYIRLAYGKNTCGITSDPTYTTGVTKK